MRMNTPHSVGSVMRGAREQAGLSRRELAQRAGLSLNSVQILESGKGNPTLDTLLRVAAVLGLDLIAEPSSDPSRDHLTLPRSATSRQRGSAISRRATQEKKSAKPETTRGRSNSAPSPTRRRASKQQDSTPPVDLDAHLASFARLNA